MLFSVIVPVYNLYDYIERCIESILRQSMSDYELILIDDGSTDQSDILCDEYSKKSDKIHVIHKKNGGVSSARNCGIEYAKGEYLVFVDGDDFLTTDYLEVLASNLKDSPELLRSYFILCNDENQIQSKRKHKENVIHINSDKMRAQVISDLIEGRHDGWEVCGCAIKKKCITENGIAFENGFNYAEDLDFCIKVVSVANKIKTIDYSGYCYYQRNESMMHTVESSSKVVELNNLLKNEYDFIKGEFLKKHFYIFYFHIILAHFSKGKLLDGTYKESIDSITCTEFYTRMEKCLKCSGLQYYKIYGVKRGFTRKIKAKGYILNHLLCRCIYVLYLKIKRGAPV